MFRLTDVYTAAYLPPSYIHMYVVCIKIKLLHTHYLTLYPSGSKIPYMCI